MKEIILDTILDTIKLLPFLFIAFLIIEYIEHKLTDKSKKVITKSKKYGPVLGSILGVIPQCGFSALATNLYITRIITLGTLFSVYLSTSDEMLPILISEKVEINTIIKILLIKMLFGMLYGIIIDIVIRKNKIKRKEENYDICNEEHCHCEKGIIIPSLKHTLNITLYIFIITFILNTIFYYIGEDYLSKLFLKNTIYGPFITSLIGLIPNCGASVVITELYINNTISYASLIGGLLTGSGSALLILFKQNKNIKENIFIASLLYLLGAFSGLIIEIIYLII